MATRPLTSSEQPDFSETWQTVLTQLQLQMTRATFDTWLKDSWLMSADDGLWQIGVKNGMAKDWLENRLYNTIARTVADIAGQPVELKFVFDQAASTSPQVTDIPSGGHQSFSSPAESEADKLSPGQVIAQADYYKGFFEKGGAGFSQLVHHTTYFWMPLLGPAFFLWKLLDSEDTRSLKSIKPNFWSPPQKYSYADLAAKLNREHGRYICGDALECHQSRLARQAGQPLQGKEDCCRSPSYAWLRLTPHPKGQGLICKHWKDGLLEILRQVGLAVVELKPGERKPTIQVWRMPPIITPWQYAHLNSHIQSDYDDWLDRFGLLFNIHDRQEWRSIAEQSIVPLMPAYDQAQVTDNFDQRRKRQEFLRDAFPNPNFVPDIAQHLIE